MGVRCNNGAVSVACLAKVGLAGVLVPSAISGWRVGGGGEGERRKGEEGRTGREKERRTRARRRREDVEFF